ncbi:hypothetical protein [Isorropodon fossajaponicum symbiont]|uniref:hypothetical protein n=1 Tax=Isorropodon fossajaponicum symbiont TaxID=883811 RepID=UPI003159D9FA
MYDKILKYSENPTSKRTTPADIPQHIIQRGNNKQACFSSELDMKAYLKWLTDFSAQYGVAIHA